MNPRTLPQTVKDMAEWRLQAVEAIGSVPGYALQPKPDGEVYTVPHPLMVSDEVNEALPLTKGAVATAKLLLDPDRYERFKADGGRAGDVLLAWRMMAEEVNVVPNSSVYLAWSANAADSSKATSPVTVPANIVPSINGGVPPSPVPVS